MIDLSTPNEWQHKDESLGGILFPWYTKSFLDELVTWDLKGKAVFEFGCGASTLWFASKVPVVYGVENNTEYRNAILKELKKRSCEIDFYIEYDLSQPFLMFGSPYHPMFDIIAIDCEPVEKRDDCILIAIEHLKPGGKLIIDNWLQPSVGMASEETQALLASYPCQIYKQEGHPDWQTAVFTI